MSNIPSPEEIRTRIADQLAAQDNAAQSKKTEAAAIAQSHAQREHAKVEAAVQAALTRMPQMVEAAMLAGANTLILIKYSNAIPFDTQMPNERELVENTLRAKLSDYKVTSIQVEHPWRVQAKAVWALQLQAGKPQAKVYVPENIPNTVGDRESHFSYLLVGW